MSGGIEILQKSQTEWESLALLQRATLLRRVVMVAIACAICGWLGLARAQEQASSRQSTHHPATLSTRSLGERPDLSQQIKQAGYSTCRAATRKALIRPIPSCRR
jgi:hypothetical protein